MSIVVAVKVPEGLVLAADSASTLEITQGDRTGVAMIYSNANKLMQLKDYPVGVATWGAGTLGARTVISFVEEFENELGSYRRVKNEVSVEGIARKLKDFLLQQFAKQGLDRPPEPQQPKIGILVGGYSAGQFFSEHFVFNVPQGEFTDARPNLSSGQPDFGANWYGATDAIVRLHFGRDEHVLDILKRLGIADDVVSRAMEIMKTEIQYPVPFNAMPLRDAIAYADYVVSVVIGRFRFVIGAPLCGGPVDIAAIKKKEGFNWVKRKGIGAA